MLELALRLYRKSENEWELRLPHSFRFVFGFIVLITLTGMIAVGRFYAFPLVIVLISFAATLYNETWIIDRNREVFEYRFGLLFLFKRREIPFSEVSSLKVKRFTKGLPSDRGLAKPTTLRRDFIRISLITKDDRMINMETHKETRNEDLYKSAHDIAEFCGKPIEED